MNTKLATTMLMAGMVGGQQAAIAVLENANNDVVGTSDKGVLLLPRPRSAEDLKIAQAWGFEWPAGQDKYDRNMRSQELCVEVKVPAGWQVKPTDHWLYKNVIDPKGQVRASLMIHHQDHDSWFDVTPKYRATTWQANYDDHEPCWPVIEDSNGNVVWVGNMVAADPDHRQKHTKYWQDFHAAKRDDFDNAEKNSPRSPSEIARDTSQKVLLEDLAIDPKDQKWFDEPAVFPESVGQLPDVKTYELRTEFYHGYGGSYADGGSSPLRFADDKSAIEYAKKRFTRSTGYHRKATLRNPYGEKIWDYEDPRPKQALCGYDRINTWGEFR